MTGWADALDRLLLAPSKAAAAAEAAYLIDQTTPGGAAISDDCDGFVESVRITMLLAGEHRAYLLAVLIWIAQCNGAWTPVLEAGSRSGQVLRHVEAERRVAAMLGDLAANLEAAPPDGDPEVRSVTYRLLGLAGVPQLRHVPFLMRAADREKDELAAACATQGVFIALIRSLPIRDEDFEVWVRDALGRRAMVRERLQSGVRFAGTSNPSSKAQMILGHPLQEMDGINTEVWWPVERI